MAVNKDREKATRAKKQSGTKFHCNRQEWHEAAQVYRGSRER
jgi:hypothetical protein